MSYHKKEIVKGVLGQFSKIREEFLEAEDSFEQNNKIMLLLELSDLLGAIEAFYEINGMTLEDGLIMMNATKNAFQTGYRK